MQSRTHEADNETVRRKIITSIQHKITKGITTQKTLAEAIGVSQATFSRRIGENDTDFSEDESFFNLFELLRIAEFLGISLEELFTGVAPENKAEHSATGLDNDSINWLKKNRIEKEYMLEIVDIVFGNSEIADALFEAMYLYSTSYIPTTYYPKHSGDNKVISRFTKEIADDSLLLKYAMTGCFNDILEMIKRHYNKTPNNYYLRNREEQEKQLFAAHFENLKKSLISIANETSRIIQEEKDDIEDFDREAREYCER